MVDTPFDERWKYAPELSIAASTFTGATVALGTLIHVPVLMVMQNDTTVSVFLSDDGTSTNGKTFIVGERIVLDIRTNKGNANAAAFPIGTIFSVTGSVGTGTFKISYIYVQ